MPGSRPGMTMRATSNEVWYKAAARLSARQTTAPEGSATKCVSEDLNAACWPYCDFVDPGLSGLALCLSGGDMPERGMEPLTIVASFLAV
jgi:hypothetical protein